MKNVLLELWQMVRQKLEKQRLTKILRKHKRLQLQTHTNVFGMVSFEFFVYIYL